MAGLDTRARLRERRPHTARRRPRAVVGACGRHLDVGHGGVGTSGRRGRLRAGSVDQCGDKSAWHFDNKDAPTRIGLAAGTAALAHGIEAPQERSAAGKNESGKISISLRQESNEIALVLADDGAGLDIAKLR